MTDKLPWTEIERRIHALRDEMLLLIERFPEAKELMPRFAELAGEILEAVEDSRVDEASVRICDILFDHGYVDGFEGVTFDGATFEGMTFESVTPDAQDTGGERGAGDV